MFHYINIKGLSGSATAQGHDGWIEIDQYRFGGQRAVKTYTGCGANRAKGVPTIGNIHISKKMDKSSPLLFQYFVSGNNIDEMTLDCCQSGDVSEPYQQLILNNVMIANYTQDSHEQKEYISFDFTNIETKYIPVKQANCSDAPISAGFDIASAKVS